MPGKIRLRFVYAIPVAGSTRDPVAVQRVYPGMDWPSAPRILCFDIDAAFCQAAYIAWPDRLRGVDLLIVGGHPEKRGVVASCTYAVRARGVHSGMSMARALSLCPEAVAAPVPWNSVRRLSRQVFCIVERYAVRLERASIDEGFLLLPESSEHPEDVARRIRRAILDEAGITISIGISAVRFIAKMATAHAKPKPGSAGTGVFAVPPGTEVQFLDGQELGAIPFVGPAFVDALAKRGIRTIPAARRMELNTLVRWLKPARAHFLHDRVRGIDPHRVGEEPGERKSISSENTFERDIIDPALVDKALRELVADVGASLRRMALRTKTVNVKIRESGYRGDRFVDHQKSHTLRQFVETDRVIFETAHSLLRELRRNYAGPIRLLHVGLSSLTGPGSAEQLAFPEIIPPLETEQERAQQSASA